ncbi:protein of unknown function [Saccharopolyspora shandongensis]|uniref:DUF397 domain-containing protein n=1 Tax=Saccharopolyspora shandongensis TaxID=418495 RepID=A0A1H3H508_9PSEU|nr:DUF397 domain-containing protein [Saccharopolyspora shandongensis]SDY10602.1 protein of unknown function [Saccharopolyspora shandongensis]
MTSVDLNLRAWRKSSYSGNDGGNCVEVGAAPSARGVRDSKLGESSPVLAFSCDAWASFLGKIKAGGFRR